MSNIQQDQSLKPSVEDNPPRRLEDPGPEPSPVRPKISKEAFLENARRVSLLEFNLKSQFYGFSKSEIKSALKAIAAEYDLKVLSSNIPVGFASQPGQAKSKTKVPQGKKADQNLKVQSDPVCQTINSSLKACGSLLTELYDREGFDTVVDELKKAQKRLRLGIQERRKIFRAGGNPGSFQKPLPGKDFYENIVGALDITETPIKYDRKLHSKLPSEIVG
jgi:hypothetical protein